MSDRPLVVLVGGAPGSGKTTLASALSKELLLPHLNKDDLVHGVWRTKLRAFELGLAGVELFYLTMELWLRGGISFVADQTFVRGVSEPDIAARLAPRSALVNVHCFSPDVPERWERRMRSQMLCGEGRLAKLRPQIRTLQQELSEPLNFGCPTVVVDTRAGYCPGMGDLVETINGIYGRPTIHDLDKPSLSLA